MDIVQTFSRLKIIENSKIIFYVFLLIYVCLEQITQKYFINIGLWGPVLWVLMLVFSLHLFIVLNWQRWPQHKNLYIFLWTIDIFVLSYLAYLLPKHQAFFIFIFLLHISLASLWGNRRASFYIAALCSLSFSVLLAIGPELSRSNMLLAAGMNNLAFFAVAFLSARLSEQIDTLGEELEESSKRLKVLKDLNQLVLESINSAFLSLNSKGVVQIANSAALKLFQNQVFENSHFFYSNPDLADKIKNSSSGQVFEFYYKDGSGTDHLLAISATKIFSNTNDVNENDTEYLIGYVILISDLTDYKNLQLQLRQQEKLAAVGQLAASIAHEIRNPLASMTGSIQFLQSTLKLDNPDDKHLMQIVIRESARLNQLITEFLDFVKPEQKNYENVDIVFLLKECLQIVKMNPNLDKNIEHILQVPEKCIVIGSAAKLKQVFLNLFINAYHAMENTEQKTLQISLEELKDSCVLKIKDSGCGMSAEVLRRLFEPFHTTKAKGTGLGLASVHKILESHDAIITVSSKEQLGSEFSIKFSKLN